MNIFLKSLAVIVFLLYVVPLSVSAQETYVIEMREEGFVPNNLTIEKGDSIRFVPVHDASWWPASNIHPTHGLYPDSGIEKCDTGEEENIFDACTGLRIGEEYLFTFDHPGTWPFHDHIEPRFKGVIEVTGDVEMAEESLFSRITTSISSFFRGISSLFSFGLSADLKEVDMITIALEDRDTLNGWLSRIGPKDVMAELLNDSYVDGVSTRDCHQAAHNVGRASYELFGEEIFTLCSAECHSGCYHGGTEAYFRDNGTQNLEEDLDLICNSELNPFFSHQCIHGVGHGLMAWSDYELIDALEQCDLLSGSHGSCYSGVFMENVIGGLAEDQGHFSEYLSDDPHFPCDIVPEKYKSACYFYQTSRMKELLDYDYVRVGEECGKVEVAYRNFCFESMGRDIGGDFQGNVLGAITMCEKASTGEDRHGCIRGASQNTFWDPSGQGEALLFCQLLSEPDEKEVCYQTITYRAPQVLISKKELKQFCSKIEEPYQYLCEDFY